jgi:hypothetical protein
LGDKRTSLFRRDNGFVAFTSDQALVASYANATVEVYVADRSRPTVSSASPQLGHAEHRHVLRHRGERGTNGKVLSPAETNGDKDVFLRYRHGT